MSERQIYDPSASTIDMGDSGLSQGEEGTEALAKYLHERTGYRLLARWGDEVLVVFVCPNWGR